MLCEQILCLCMANCNSGLVCSIKTPLYTLKAANCPKTRVSGHAYPHLPRQTNSATIACANLALGPLLLKLSGPGWLSTRIGIPLRFSSPGLGQQTADPDIGNGTATAYSSYRSLLEHEFATHRQKSVRSCARDSWDLAS